MIEPSPVQYWLPRQHFLSSAFEGSAIRRGYCNVPLLLQSFRHIPSCSAVLRHYIIIATQRYMRAPLLSQRNHSDLLLPAFGPFYPFYHMFLASFPFVSMFAYLPSWSSVLYRMEHSRYSYSGQKNCSNVWCMSIISLITWRILKLKT